MATPPPSKDPFYLIRADISAQYNEIQQKLNRFHMLAASSQERTTLAREVDSECDSIRDQIEMLREAVDTAAENPARFNLTMEEINSRRKWLETTARTVTGIKDSIKTMTTAKPYVPTAADRVQAANNTYLQGEQQKQEQLIRQQDDQLGDIEKGVDNISGIAKQIHEHIQEDERILTQLDGEMDTTLSRLKATGKKMAEILRKSGTTTQLTAIIFLVCVLIVLAVFVFY